MIGRLRTVTVELPGVTGCDIRRLTTAQAFRGLAVALACVASPALASAEPRVALVIGNNAYEAAPLENPINDAALIADTLRTVGFDVTTVRDADEDAMEEAVARLGERLQAAGPGAVGLFYYAGHGVQSSAGKNYLIPVGAAIKSESRLTAKAVSADWVLGTMQDAGNAVNVLVLDACRNNPYVATRGARGLAAMAPGSDSLIAFSAAAGQTAEDGDGRNSPYASALAAEMRRAGQTFAQVFQNVRKRVLEGQRHRPVNERQTPTEVSQLTRDHYFVGASGAPVRERREPDTVDWAREEWEQIKGTSRTDVLETFVGRYAGSQYAELAKLRLGELRRSERTAYRDGQMFSDALRSGGRGPEMVVIPAGAFRMGCVSGLDCYSFEKPVHEVRIGARFALGRYEVTFAEWDACVSGGGCRGYRPDGEGWGRGNRPVNHVSWEDAREYAAWLSRETGEAYRLPNESEWEYAARAGSTTKYHFGNEEDELCRWANGADMTAKSQYPDWTVSECRDGHVYTALVGSLGANRFGLHDMHGNVWEWTEDCWNDSYAGAPADGSAWLRGDCAKRVLRGGSWDVAPGVLRAANRVRETTGYRDNGSGFRVARTLAP